MHSRQPVISMFYLFCLASCEQVDVGVSWYILDNQLTASSELNASTPAKNGRLNFVAGSSWCASMSDSSPYLQIDLQIPYIICAVSTQGNSQGSQWVESYTLQSSTEGTTWTDYEENGQVKVVRFKGAYIKCPAYHFKKEKRFFRECFCKKRRPLLTTLLRIRTHFLLHEARRSTIRFSPLNGMLVCSKVIPSEIRCTCILRWKKLQACKGAKFVINGSNAMW